MVGVAGKSKGCHTCRKRKIKCDGSRPTCKQCARGSWNCEGYEREAVFLNQYLSTYKRRSPHGLNKTSNYDPASRYDVISLPYLQETATASWTSSSSSELRSFTHVVNMALYDQVLGSFITFCLPTGASEEVPLAWLSSLCQGSLKSKTLSLAAAGVGYGWMGHEEHCPDARQRGHSLYCSALSSAQILLSQHRSGFNYELLPVVMMLLLYEIFEYGTQSSVGWEAHVTGIETIMQLYGPHNFANPLNFEMFYFYRTIGILRSLTFRRPTFLSREEWINAPWALRTKNPFHQFLDLATEVPSLLEEIDRLAASIGDVRGESVHSDHSQDVALRALSLITRLELWEKVKSPHLTHGPPHTFSSGGSTSMIATDRLQPRAHRYPSRNPRATADDFDELQSARLMLFYWAVMLTLHTSVYNISHFSVFCAAGSNENSVTASLSPTCSVDYLEMEADDLADKITLWADFCCQNAWQSFGPAIGIFSVKAAIEWYRARQMGQLQELQLKKCRTLLGHLTYCDRNDQYS